MKNALNREAILRLLQQLVIGTSIAAGMGTWAFAQKGLTWDDAKRELRTTNPTLCTAQIDIQEARAEEITALLRPNPDLTVSIDRINPFTGNPCRRFGDTEPVISSRYLVERRHQRELRPARAREGTATLLLDLLQAEQGYRDIQLTYLNPVGAFLATAHRSNFARGTRGYFMKRRVFCDSRRSASGG